MSKQNYYTVMGIPETSGYDVINKVNRKYLQEKANGGPEIPAKEEALATLMDNKKREKYNKRPEIAKLRNPDMTKVQAFNIGSSEAFKRKQNEAGLQVSTQDTYEQQRGSNEVLPSPRGVADAQQSPEQTKRKPVQRQQNSKEFAAIKQEAIKQEAIKQKKASKKTFTRSSPPSQDREANAKRVENEIKEKEVHAKLFAARSFASKIRRGFSSTIKLSAKEELMKEELMSKSLEDLKATDMKKLSTEKRDFRRAQRGGGGR